MRRLLWSALLLSSPVIAGTPLPEGPHIVISADAKVSAKPDSARIRFAFESRASTVLPAKQSVDAAVDRLLEGLNGFGIASVDIQASDLRTSEDVDYSNFSGKRVSNGYDANRTVTVLLRDLSRINDLLDFGLAAGAKNFDSVEFESSQAEQLRIQAKQKAVEKARQQAAETAQSFGAALGPIYSIDSVNSQVTREWEGRTLDSVVMTGSQRRAQYLQPTVEYSATVNAVFELKR